MYKYLYQFIAVEGGFDVGQGKYIYSVVFQLIT